MYQATTHSDALTSLQNHIIVKKNYVMALHKRLVLVREKYALKTDHEKNEVDIIMYETLAKINVATNSIKQLEIEFSNLFHEFMNNLIELNEHYDTFLDLAKKHQSDDVGLKHLLYHANWKYINDNVDEKINFYQSLKDALQKYLHKEDNK